jgi:hypothetical protein
VRAVVAAAAAAFFFEVALRELMIVWMCWPDFLVIGFPPCLLLNFNRVLANPK